MLIFKLFEVFRDFEFLLHKAGHFKVDVRSSFAS